MQQVNFVHFPNNYIQQYLDICSKLKKFERIVFKRFAPNILDVSREFAQLAGKFDEIQLYQYAAMCYLGAAKSEGFLGNKLTETEYLLKSARKFVKADEEIEALNLRSNKREYIEGALKVYNQVLSKLDEDSVIRASIIREIREINPNCENTSSFNSPCHRIYDLELTAKENIKSEDFFQALEKLTDILDNIVERKVEPLYTNLLNEIEILCLLLLVILDLPPIRQSPSYIKLIEKYYNLQYDFCYNKETDLGIPFEIRMILSNIVIGWKNRDYKLLSLSSQNLMKYKSLTEEQKILSNKILIVYCE